MTLPFPTEIVPFILWLAVNGLTVVAVLEKFPAWQKLTARQKSVAAFLLIAGSPFLSEGLMTLTKSIPLETLTLVQHYLDLGLNGIRLWAASQYAHGGLRQLVQPK